MPLPLLLALSLLAGSHPGIADGQVTTGPTATSPQAAAVAANNGFGVDLFRAMAAARPEGNLFLSPLSAAMALAMTAEGAAGESEREMMSVLHAPTSVPPGDRAVTWLHEGFAILTRELTAAQGVADGATRARIADLRAALEEANTKTRSLEASGHWRDAAVSHEDARRLAGDLNALLGSVDRFDLRIANALWVERSYSLAPAYVATIDRFYGSGAANVLDIAGDPEGARRRINDWVEGKTERRIRDLIPSGMLSAVTRLAITNAIYFKGEWTVPFAESLTRTEPFTRGDGTLGEARMMSDPTRGDASYAAFTGTGEYFETPTEVPVREADRPPTYPDDAGVQIVQLPYKGGDVAMVLLLPRSSDGLPSLTARLDAESLAAWLDRLVVRTVQTSLPKFTVESQAELSVPLKELGIRRAFISPDNPNGAQFPGMNPSEDPAHQLFIGAVLHKAWVEVSERGTEAAAATAVMMAPGGAMPEQPKMIPFVPVFRADRPFLFLIRDTKSGAILFMGRVTAP